MRNELRRLIEAVENGTLDARCVEAVFKEPIFTAENGDFWKAAQVHAAYRGSVDAAIALCEVLLPGWAIERMSSWPGKPCIASLWGTHELGDERWHKFEDGRVDAEGPTLARALLLAVLRAKLMEASHE